MVRRRSNTLCVQCWVLIFLVICGVAVTITMAETWSIPVTLGFGCMLILPLGILSIVDVVWGMARDVESQAACEKDTLHGLHAVTASVEELNNNLKIGMNSVNQSLGSVSKTMKYISELQDFIADNAEEMKNIQRQTAELTKILVALNKQSGA